MTHPPRDSASGPSARREPEPARQALTEAGPDGGAAETAAATGSRRGWAKPALAAGLFLGVLASGMLVRSRLFGEPVHVISDLSLDGRQVIVARGTILAQAVEIRSGSRIELLAAGAVALGDGLVVTKGATLVMKGGSRSGYWRSWLKRTW